MKWMVMGNCELQRLDRTFQRPGKVARDRFSEFFSGLLRISACLPKI